MHKHASQPQPPEASGFITSIWHTLITPRGVQPGTSRYRQARLLAMLHLLLIPLAVVSAVIQLSASDAFLSTFRAIMFAVAIMVIAYVTNRAGYYRTAATITSILPTVASLAALIANPDDMAAFGFPLLSVVVSTMFLPVTFTAVIAVINVAMIALLPQFIGAFTYHAVMGPLSLNIILPSLLILGAYNRQLIDADRRARLRESEMRYRDLFDRVPIGLYRTTPDGEIVEGNQTLAAMMGFDTREELLAQNASTLYADAADRQQIIAQIAQHDSVLVKESQLQRRDGSTLWVKNNFRVIRDAAGQPVFQEGSLEDITERRNTEEALRASNALFKAIFEGAAIGIAVSTLEGKVFQANPVFIDMLGFSPAELRQMTFAEFTHPEDRGRNLSLFKELIAEQRDGYLLEKRYLRKNGEIVWVRIAVTAQRDPAGAPEMVIAMVEDITSRKRVETQLQASELRFRTIIEQSPWSTVVYAADGRMLMYNEAAIDLWQLSEDEVAHLLSYYNILADQQLAEQGIMPLVERCFAGEALQSPPYFVKDWHRQTPPSGARTEMWLITHFYPVKDDAGSVQQVVVIHEDITERMIAEQAEREQRTLAEALVDTAALINSSLNLDSVLEQILQAAGRVVAHDAADIMLVEGGVAQVVRQAGYPTQGTSETEIESVRIGVKDLPAHWRMAETGEPIFITDTTKFEAWVELQSNPWIRSHVSAPILVGDELIGFINLNSATPATFGPEEARRLKAFADQAAVAIQNARLYQLSQGQKDQLEALRQATLDITQALELDALLSTLVQRALDLLDVESGGMYLYREDRDLLEWIVSIGAHSAPVGTTLGRGEGMAGKIWESDGPLIIPDYSAWEGRSSDYEEYTFGSVIGMPIRRGDQFLGIIHAVTGDDDHRTFGEDDLRLLRLIADQAAVAIQNAQLFKLAQDQASQLESLRQATLDVTRQLELDDVLATLVRRGLDLLGLESGGAYIHRPEQDHLEWIVSFGNAVPVGSITRRGEGLSGHIWESREPMVLDDYAVWPGRAVQYEDFPIHHVMGVPVQRGEEFLGVLLAHADDVPGRRFSDEDVRLLSLFADQAAVAIHNAQLYERIQEYATVLEDRVAERTAELEEANRELTQVAAVKDEFVSNVSHELRTPIANIKLYLELLRLNIEKREAYMETLARETDRLEFLVEDLLYLSRLDQHRLEIQPAPVDLNALAEIYIVDRTMLAQERSLTLNFVPAPDLLPVHGDEMQLGKAFSVLITNALNYTPPGGQVTVWTAQEVVNGAPWVAISVQDTGPGILPEERAQLFERFFRGRVGLDMKMPGTGLGLAIAREIIESYGGRIDVESDGVTGQGATFTIRLPAERDLSSPP